MSAIKPVTKTASKTTTKPTVRKSLTSLIKVAITKKDIKTLYDLKHICDIIHQTGESYQGYKPSDLPSDTLYEEMTRLIESSASDVVEMVIAESTTSTEDTVKHRHQKLISDLWMGSITKETEIREIPQSILLPKFDGCSCGIKLKRYVSNNEFELIQAVTRGTTEGYNVKQSDITEKFKLLSVPFVKALSSELANSIKLNDDLHPDKLFGNVLQITIRGEIVLKDRTKCKTAPASVVAGKINGHMAVWQESLPLIEFIPYEIIRCNYDLTDYYNYYVPTQEETINIFNKLKLINFPTVIQDLNPDSLSFIQAHFAKLNETIPQPMDGVVYCSASWRYPIYNEQTKPKQYGKYAWKPSSEATSTLKTITYSLARDGKFTFILSYEPVKINGKLYRNAKTATSRMVQLQGIGIGSVITVKLAGDISPMVTDFLNDDSAEIKPFELPKTCPFCKTKTELRKGKTPTLSCPNPECPEVVKQKMLNFLSTMGIKGVAEGKLNKLKKINFENVDLEYLPEGLVEQKLTKTDTRTFLVALGIGGQQAVTKKLKEYSDMNPLATIKNNFDDIVVFLTNYMEEDPFIEDIINYSETVLFGEEE